MTKKTFDFEIEEVIECVKESPKTTWGKYVARISFDGKPAEINIRNIDIPNNRISTGITLTSEEIEEVTNTFIRMGYGSTELMETEHKKRTSRFKGFSFREPPKDDHIHIDIEK